jgi:hypothetical protein
VTPQVTPRERYDAGLPAQGKDERARYAEYDACRSDADRAYAGQMRAFGVTEMAGSGAK